MVLVGIVKFLIQNNFKMKKSIYVTGLLLVFNMSLVFAQDENPQIEKEETEKAKFSFSGSVDSYFRTNLNADFEQAPGTSFANLPGFSLGMANIVAEQSFSNVGFVGDFVFGPRGEDATFLSPFLRPGGNSSIVNQLYAYYDVSDKVTLTLGNFNTFLGYEVISPTGNFNYSTSYLFSYGPFSHTGFKADFDLGKGFTLMTGLFNPTDATEFNPTNDYVAGVQLGYSEGGLSVYLNALADATSEEDEDAFTQFDITATYDLTDNFFIGFNSSVASDSFFGLAGYLQYKTSEKLKLGLRVESFEDRGVGAIGGTTELYQDVLDLTLSANYSVGSLTIIPELRMDIFSSDIITNEEVLQDQLSSFVLAAVYGF